MPQSEDFRLAARGRWVRVAGLAVYILAFFLPAVRDRAPAGAPDISGNAYKGWFCAVVTLTNSFSRDVWTSNGFLAILSGWINPLILVYLILLLRQRLVWPRRIVASAVVAFMFDTWVYFAVANMVPLIGHELWIVGALMILAGEIVRKKAPRAEIDAARTLQV